MLSSHIYRSDSRDSESDVGRSLALLLWFELMALESKLALFQLGLRGSLAKLSERRFTTRE